MFMERILFKGIEIWIGVAGFFLGLVKGSKAKERWVVKMQSGLNQKRRQAENRNLQRNGIVPLDDIELASYHR